MAGELCTSLRANGRRGRTVGIKVRLSDFTTITRAHTLAEPTCDPELVSSQALRLLSKYAPARPVRLLGVRVAGLTRRERDGDSATGERGGQEEHGRAQMALPL
jgi:DNA polymerase-4